MRIGESAAPAIMGDIASAFAEGNPEIVKKLVEQFLSATAEKITEKLMSRYRGNIEDKIDFAAGLLIGAFTRVIPHVFSPPDTTKIEGEIKDEMRLSPYPAKPG